MLNNKIIFYGGIPRSGSHLLSGILNQNPIIHSEGSSALCRISWDLYQSMNNPVTKKELQFFNRDSIFFQQKVAHSLINSYYDGIKDKVLFEKNRSWTTKENIEMIKSTIDESPKFVLMTRDLEESAKSFIEIHLKSGFSQSEAEQVILNFNQKGTNPFMRPIAATVWAKITNDGSNFLFIDYEDLIKNTNDILNNLYDFIQLESFDHDLNNISMEYKESNHLIGLADVRKSISKRKNSINLSSAAKEKIEYINYIFKLCESPKINLTEIEKFYYENCF